MTAQGHRGSLVLRECSNVERPYKTMTIFKLHVLHITAEVLKLSTGHIISKFLRVQFILLPF